MSCKKLHHYFIYLLVCNLSIIMYQWILVRMDERKSNQYSWHGRENFMVNKHCISSCKRPNLTQAKKMVINLSMSFPMYPTINLSWVHLQRGSNLLLKWRKWQHCLCYVVNDAILLKLRTSHTHEVEEIWNANLCKNSLCNIMLENKINLETSHSFEHNTCLILVDLEQDSWII
jgi:hypothetical protein